jgi:hypothetical protein
LRIVVNADGGFEIIFGFSWIKVDKLLRIAVHQGGPGTLNLYHQPMAFPGSMEEIRHLKTKGVTSWDLKTSGRLAAKRWSSIMYWVLRMRWVRLWDGTGCAGSETNFNKIRDYCYLTKWGIAGFIKTKKPLHFT